MKGGVIQRLGRLFGRGCLGRGDVAENQLSQLIRLAIPPDLQDIIYTLVDLGSGFVREQLVDNPLVQPQLAAIRSDLEHIVHGWVNRSAVYCGCSLRKGFYHLLLVFGRLGYNVVILHLRCGKVQLVGGLDVRHLFEQVHQLRQVKELGKPRPRPIAGAFRCQLQRRDGFPETAGPAVKMGHAQFLQTVILKIPLHGVKLGHTVADRGSSGKDNAPAAGNLIHVAALGEHIR